MHSIGFVPGGIVSEKVLWKLNEKLHTYHQVSLYFILKLLTWKLQNQESEIFIFVIPVFGVSVLLEVEVKIRWVGGWGGVLDILK